MSGGELTTVATIDEPVREDFLFPLGSAGEGDDQDELAPAAARTHDMSYPRDRRRSLFAAPEYTAFTDAYASLGDV
jgi:hypothetical protein